MSMSRIIMNKAFFANKISERIMKEFYEYSMITTETYDLIELFYRASGCETQEEFCQKFVMVDPCSGKCFQCLFYKEDEGFDDTWGWVIDTNAMDEIMNDGKDCE